MPPENISLKCVDGHSYANNLLYETQPAFTCSKLETVEQEVKYVQS